MKKKKINKIKKQQKHSRKHKKTIRHRRYSRKYKGGGGFINSVKKYFRGESQELMQRLKAHRGRVTSVSFNHNGTRIVSGSVDETVRVWEWDVATKKYVLVLTHKADIYNRENSVSFSPDGNKIVSGSDYNKLRVWELDDNKKEYHLIRKLCGDTGDTGGDAGRDNDVTSVSFSRVGTRLVSGNSDNTVRVWEWDVANKTYELIQTLTGHGTTVNSVSFSPDGTRIVSGGSWPDNSVRIWELNDETKKYNLKYTLTGRKYGGSELDSGHGGYSHVNSVSFSHDGTRIVSGGGRPDNTVRVWNAKTGGIIKILHADNGGVYSVSFNHNGTRIVSGGGDKIVRVWDAVTGEAISTFEGHTGSVRSVSFSHDGTRIVSGGDDKIVRVWNAEEDENKRKANDTTTTTTANNNNNNNTI